MSDFINTLPEEILVKIFTRVPLQSLIYLDQVCHRWIGAQELVLSKIITLTLYQSAFHFRWFHNNCSYFFRLHYFATLDYNPLHDHTAISVPSQLITEQMAHQLTRKLPNITKLYIYGFNFANDNIPEILFKQWNELETLVVMISSRDEKIRNDNWLTLVDGMRPTLKHVAMHGVDAGNLSNLKFY